MRFLAIIAFVFAALSIAALNMGCSNNREQTQTRIPAAISADAEKRWADLVAKHRTVSAGMSPEEVQQILGKPDEVHPLYEPQIMKPRRIGTSWFYMREPQIGLELGNATIAVRFDLNDRVTNVQRLYQ